MWSDAIASGLSIWASFVWVSGLPRLPFLPLSAHGRPSIATRALTMSADEISAPRATLPSLANTSRMSASRSLSRKALSLSVLITENLAGHSARPQNGISSPKSSARDLLVAAGLSCFGLNEARDRVCRLRFCAASHSPKNRRRRSLQSRSDQDACLDPCGH